MKAEGKTYPLPGQKNFTSGPAVLQNISDFQQQQQKNTKHGKSRKKNPQTAKRQNKIRTIHRSDSSVGTIKQGT